MYFDIFCNVFGPGDTPVLDAADELYAFGLKRFPTSTMFLLRAQVCIEWSMLLIHAISSIMFYLCLVSFLQHCFIYKPHTASALNLLSRAEKHEPIFSESFTIYFFRMSRGVRKYMSERMCDYIIFLSYASFVLYRIQAKGVTKILFHTCPVRNIRNRPGIMMSRPLNFN